MNYHSASILRLDPASHTNCMSWGVTSALGVTVCGCAVAEDPPESSCVGPVHLLEVFGEGEGWYGEGKLGLPLFHELCSRLREEPGLCHECEVAQGRVVSPVFGECVGPLVAPNVAMGWVPGDGDLPDKGV